MNDHSITIEKHPFYVGVIDEADKKETKYLPFTIIFDYVYGMPRQLLSREIREALNSAYLTGSMISTPLGESDLANGRLSVMYDALLKSLDENINGKRILEIGCGTGELLRKLRNVGADVVGVEIGPQANFAKKKYSIQILEAIPEFYNDGVDKKFDCIISYGCLEHIEQLDELIEKSILNLNDGGLFFHSVPNAEISFSCGELDHLIHEHINYFTPQNAKNLLLSRGFKNVNHILTKSKNEIMFWGFKSDLKKEVMNSLVVSEELVKFTKYCEMALFKFDREVDKIHQLINKYGEIAFYAGGFEHALKLDLGKIRFFDGDSFKHGKSWLAGLKAIEKPEILIKDKPNLVIIFKRHYFKVIKQYLIDLGLNSDLIISVDDLDEYKRSIN